MLYFYECLIFILIYTWWLEALSAVNNYLCWLYIFRSDGNKEEDFEEISSAAFAVHITAGNVTWESKFYW